MTKKEIVKTICDRANNEKLMKGNLTQLATKEIVQWTFEAIIETLVREGRIELRNFGVFEVKQRKPRKARNPRTGTPVSVEAKNVVTFQPGKEMEEQVRKLAKPAEPKKKKVRKSKAAKPAETKLAEIKSAEPRPIEQKIPEPSSNGTGGAPAAETPPTVPVVAASAPPVITMPEPEPVTSEPPAT